MKISLYTLVTFLVMAYGSANFIEINRDIEKLDIPRTVFLPLEQEISHLSVNAQQKRPQKIGGRYKKKPNKKALLYKEKQFSNSEDESQQNIQTQFTLQTKKKTSLNKNINFVNHEANSRLLDQKVKNNAVFQENKFNFQRKEAFPQIDKKLKTQKQMKHITVYMIIVLSFFICIPIIQEVRNQNNIQSHKKKTKLTYCKHTKHLQKSDNQAQKNIFPNLAGYTKLVNQNQSQN